MQSDIDSAAEAQQQQTEARQYLGEMHWWPEYYDRLQAQRKAEAAQLDALCWALGRIFK
ncbi:MAG: hypothetical protein JWO52_3326 [Gammaproteobacteria bacterium]|nr:hypothetical protein [Gammaproteobacteria bacterium]